MFISDSIIVIRLLARVHIYLLFNPGSECDEKFFLNMNSENFALYEKMFHFYHDFNNHNSQMCSNATASRKAVNSFYPLVK